MAFGFFQSIRQADSLFRALDTMSARAMHAPIHIEPSPHIFIPDFLPDDIRQTMMRSIPPTESFKNIEEGGAVLPAEILGNFYWGAFDSFMRQLVWRLLTRFTPWLDEKEAELKAMGMSCNLLRPYPSFICYANPTRGVPPHVDGESSVLAALTVFGYPNGRPAPATNFFSQLGSDFLQITYFPPSIGSLFVWLNLPRALHGVAEKIEPQRLTHMVALESFPPAEA
jgi:hypothetical protein